MTKFPLTKFKRVNIIQGKRSSVTWAQLASMLEHPDVFDSKDVMPLFSFTEFKNDTRNEMNAGVVHAIVGDHDKGTMTIAEAAQVLEVNNITGLVYTTASHTEDCPRFRVIAQLSRAVDAKQHRHLVRVLNALLNGALAGESELRYQAWYYGHKKGADYECVVVNGDPMDVWEGLNFEYDPLPCDKRKTDAPVSDYAASADMLDWLPPAPEPATPEAAERIRSMLAKCGVSPAGGRKQWFDVICMIHSSQHPEAKEIAQTWSMKGGDQYDEVEFEKLWKSIKIDRHSTQTLASLYRLAKKNGWVDPALLVSARDDTYGDTSNGIRFAKKYRGQLLCIGGSKKWFHWDQVRWVECLTGEHMELAKIVAGEAVDHAAATRRDKDNSINKMNHDRALSLYNHNNKLESMMASAASIPGMSVRDRAVFDLDDMLLGVPNGVIDLRTGELVPAERDMLITKQSGTEYIKTAECPMFIKFLRDIFDGDDDVIEYVQRMCGYALSGDVTESIMFMLVGGGSNGKSVMCNIIESVMGEYCQTMRTSVLLNKKYGNDSEGQRSRVRLAGSRLALLNETNAGDVFDESAVKELASDDTINARPMYESEFSFKPTHKVFLRTNHLPIARATDRGFWRRICVIKFEQNFEGREDYGLQRRILENEAQGVLTWMIQGCMKRQAPGGSLKNMPKKIKNWTECYRDDSDIIGQWLKSRFTFGPDKRALVSLVFHDYQSIMTREMGIQKPKTRAEFTKALEERGYHRRRMNDGIYFSGIELLPSDEGVWGDISADTEM